MSDYFRVIKERPKDPIEYMVDKEYIDKMKAGYERKRDLDKID
ncbi:hypothetical protein [Pseudogracilibacillus auburnensis]|nr:hypothetical protein [Pseudogracilibacillus auburnensis]